MTAQHRWTRGWLGGNLHGQREGKEQQRVGKEQVQE
jgi:hypothetical protein